MQKALYIMILSFGMIVFPLIFGGTVSAEEVYTWENEHGVVHFGDTPTKGVQPIKMKVSNAGVNTVSEPALDLTNQPTEDSNKSQQKLAFKVKPLSEQQIKDKEICFKAYRDLTVLQSQTPIYVDERGDYAPKWKMSADNSQRRYLRDHERYQILAEYQRDIQQHCTSAFVEEAKIAAARHWEREQVCNGHKSTVLGLSRVRPVRTSDLCGQHVFSAP